MQCVQAYAVQPRPDWVKEWPAMVVLAVSAIYWSRECEDAVTGRVSLCFHSKADLGFSPC